MTPPALARDAVRQNPAVARASNPSLDSYDQPPGISELEIRGILPQDGPEDELDRVSREEVDELEALRAHRRDLRDVLRHRTGTLLQVVGEELIRRGGADDPLTETPNRDAWFVEEGERLKKRAARMKGCGETLETIEHAPCGFVRPPAGDAAVWYCDLRDCPECQRKNAAESREIARAIVSKGIRHGLRFLTFTMPNVAELETVMVGPRGGVSTVNALSRASECYTRLRELLGDEDAVETCFECKGMVPSKRTRKIVRALEGAGLELPRTCLRDGARVPWPPLCRCEEPQRRTHAIDASVRSVETTWRFEILSETASAESPPSVHVFARPWHVHLHVCADMPWVEQAVLATLWMYVTLKKWPSGAANMKGVDIRLPYRTNADGSKTYLRDVKDADELARALCEVLKYATKIADFVDCPDEEARTKGYLEWKLASARRKLHQATGSWYEWQELLDALDEDEEDEEPEEDLDGLPCTECGAIGEWRKIGVPRIDPTRSSEGFKRATVPT